MSRTLSGKGYSQYVGRLRAQVWGLGQRLSLPWHGRVTLASGAKHLRTRWEGPQRTSVPALQAGGSSTAWFPEHPEEQVS